MRHNSGRLLGNKRRSHHPGDSYAGVFICVSNSILFACYNIYIVSVSCMLDVSSHLLYPLSTLLSTDQLIAFAILDWWSIHTSLDRSGTILSIITLDLPPSEDCRLVEWAQMTYKNIPHYVIDMNRQVQIRAVVINYWLWLHIKWRHPIILTFRSMEIFGYRPRPLQPSKAYSKV